MNFLNKLTMVTLQNLKKFSKWKIFKNSRRCHQERCKQITMFKCIKCNLYFCITVKNDCFTNFHSK